MKERREEKRKKKERTKERKERKEREGGKKEGRSKEAGEIRSKGDVLLKNRQYCSLIPERKEINALSLIISQLSNVSSQTAE